jgi:hypothetical protein
MWTKEASVRYEHVKTLFEMFFGKNAWGDDREIQELFKAYSKYGLDELFGPSWRKGGTLVDHLSEGSTMSRQACDESYVC